MANLSSVLNFARVQAQTDSNGITDTKGIVFANEALLDFRRKLIADGVDASQIQEAYTDGQAGVGTYAYPSDMFWLKAIELNYANTSESDYLPAQQIDVSNISANNSFSFLRVNGDKQSPQFDDRGDWFEIFPTPTSQDNVSQLIRIFYFLEPVEYSSVSDNISYPESLDYRILGWRIASGYLYSLGKIPQGDAFNNKYEEKVEELIKTLARGVQTPTTATVPQITGWEF